jgi:lysyl endopeptidase
MKNILNDLTIFKTILFTTWLLLLTGHVFGQISQGGKPLDYPELKSAQIPVVKMPVIDHSQLKENLLQSIEQDTMNKSLVFAHNFEVHLTPLNSGEWYDSWMGIRIWRLKLLSEGAMSLNLIFDEFQLPKGSRLFLYNENRILGAYTAENNKPSGKFAVSPIEGEELIVQYEVPENVSPSANFVISTVNHDFIGITKYDDRRPLGRMAGDCNIDINCSLGNEWEELKNAVCRLIINGKRVCSGTLVNNTTRNNTPYVLTAAHCFENWEQAETTVYTFNYESPYCAPLDGDPSNSVSGAVMRAKFDSLDFALTEMTIAPPPDFRPYFAGWDRTGNLVDSAASIHHPVGDIKKIALEYDSLEYSNFSSKYINNGFLKISRWDEGVTEAGSSGGGLFNKNNLLIGTLTGGLATCTNPVRDYYERFDLSWDYHSDSTKQLKYWLDPLNSDIQTLSGQAIYTGSEFCLSFTNLNDNDQHQMISISDSAEYKGYWGGTNNLGITEITEKYNLTGNEIISGISLGVGRVHNTNDAEITVKVYNGNEIPEELIYAEIIQIKNFTEGVMNQIDFSEPVIPGKTFFIGLELSHLQPTDSFVVFQSLREPEEENHFFFKRDNTWFNYKDFSSKNAVSNVFEIVACNVDGNHINVKLAEGWNIFSVNHIPEKTEMAEIVRPLRDNKSLVKIQDELGNSFEDWGFFGGWKDHIGSVYPTEGYKINMSNPDSFHIFGFQVDYPYPIPLGKGWNIMGYPLNTSHNAMHILQPLIENGTLEKVQDEKGNSIENHSEISGWQNNIGDFNPGKGYKIKLALDDTLWIEEAYPKSTAIIPESVPTIYFSYDFNGNGVDHMNINITGLHANIMQPGDELAVFDGEICVGAISLLPHHFANQSVSIPVSASDDFGTPGFTEKNTISIKLWNSLNNREFLLEPEILKGTSTFMKHESTLMSLRKYFSTKLDNELFSEKTEINCYPNPFSNEITIEIALPEGKKVQVDILNQLGQQVRILNRKKYLPPGQHTLVWDGKTTGNQNISPGIYHVRFVTDEIQSFTKIILTEK